MKKHEYELLLKMVCDRQSSLLQTGQWHNSEYKDLEHIKIRLKKKLKRIKG